MQRWNARHIFNKCFKRNARLLWLLRVVWTVNSEHVWADVSCSELCTFFIAYITCQCLSVSTHSIFSWSAPWIEYIFRMENVWTILHWIHLHHSNVVKANTDIFGIWVVYRFIVYCISFLYIHILFQCLVHVYPYILHA